MTQSPSPLYSYVIVVMCVVSLSVGQMMFKFVSNRITSLRSLAEDPIAAAVLIAALALYGASTLGWLIALKTIPLSQAYLFNALGFLIVPLAAHFIFAEPLGGYQIVGTALVLGGLVLATR